MAATYSSSNTITTALICSHLLLKIQLSDRGCFLWHFADASTDQNIAHWEEKDLSVSIIHKVKSSYSIIPRRTWHTPANTRHFYYMLSNVGFGKNKISWLPGGEKKFWKLPFTRKGQSLLSPEAGLIFFNKKIKVRPDAWMVSAFPHPSSVTSTFISWPENSGTRRFRSLNF